MSDLTHVNVEAEVLAAFEAARRAGRSAQECYGAAVAAWRRHYPEQVPEYAARQAVNIVLRKREKLLMRVE